LRAISPCYDSGMGKKDDEAIAARNKTYLDLAKLTQTDFVSRRGVEWKLSLGLWGSIAAFVYAIIQRPDLHTRIAVMLDSECNVILAVVVTLMVLGIQITALVLLQHSHARDTRLYWRYRNLAEGKSAETADAPATTQQSIPSIDDFKRWAWFAYHVAITILVIIMAWTVVIHAPRPSPGG
jgi:hypothetical protein